MFSTINVRTLGTNIKFAEDAYSARLTLFVKCFSCNNIKVVAMQETRIPGHNESTINNYITHFSRNLEAGAKAREYGVEIAVHLDWKKFVKHVQYLNDF